MPQEFKTYVNPFLNIDNSKPLLEEVIRTWGQHPDSTHPDLYNSRVYLTDADVNELVELIIGAGFRKT